MGKSDMMNSGLDCTEYRSARYGISTQFNAHVLYVCFYRYKHTWLNRDPSASCDKKHDDTATQNRAKNTLFKYCRPTTI